MPDDIELIDIAEIIRVTGLSRTTLHRKRREDASFPRAIRLSPRRLAFRKRDLLAWIDAREGAA